MDSVRYWFFLMEGKTRDKIFFHLYQKKMLEDLLAKYWEIKCQQDILNRKMEKIKSHLKHKMKEISERQYETKDCTVSLNSVKRTSISKKDVPENIWEKYSVCTVFETLHVKKKKQAKSLIA